MVTKPDTGITISLDDPLALDPSVVGEKAASLARLRQTGLPVPRGFVNRASVFTDAALECQ